MQGRRLACCASERDFSLGSMRNGDSMPFKACAPQWLAAAFAADDLNPPVACRPTRGSEQSAMTLGGWIAATAISPQGALHEPGGAILIVEREERARHARLLSSRATLPGKA